MEDPPADRSVGTTLERRRCEGAASTGPGGINFVRKRGHPVVGQHIFEGLPHDNGGVLTVSDGDDHIGAMDCETFSADTAGAQHDDAAA